MQFGFGLLLLGTAVAAKRGFELIPEISNLHLLQEYTLTPSITYNRTDQCAQQCARAPQCSLFSFNREVQTCQLYGDIMYFDETLAPQSPGKRYYAYRTAWCRLSDGFFMLRSTNLCVKLMTDKKTYDEAVLFCHQFGARLIVLENEDKATAVINLLGILGLNDNRFYLGADDRDREGQFVWADGRHMVRSWWDDGEPSNSSSEDCVNLIHGRLRDNFCDRERRFICEMPR